MVLRNDPCDVRDVLADIEAQMMDFLHLVRRPDVSEGADKEEPDAAR